MFGEEVNESLDFSLSIIVDWGSFSSSGIELNSGESFNGDSRNFVKSSIHLGNNDIRSVSKLLSQFIVFGLQSLAVSAPRGVELNQNILGFVHNNGFEGLSDNNLDGLVVNFRNGFRFESGLDSAIGNIFEESNDIGGIKFSIEEEFLDFFILENDHSESVSLSGGVSDEFSQSRSESFTDERSTHEDSSFEGSGDFLHEGVDKAGLLLGVEHSEES